MRETSMAVLPVLVVNYFMRAPCRDLRLSYGTSDIVQCQMSASRRISKFYDFAALGNVAALCAARGRNRL